MPIWLKVKREKKAKPMQRKDIFIAAFVLLLVGAIGYIWLSPTGLQQAPAIDLKIVDGRTLNLKQLQGKPVIVTFWATTCPSCLKEMPHLVELYKEFHHAGLEIIGIAMAYDPPNQVMALRQRRNIPYPIALDIDSQAALAFGDVKLTPTTFLVAPDGRIVQHKIGDLNIPLVKNQIIAMLNTQKKNKG